MSREWFGDSGIHQKQGSLPSELLVARDQGGGKRSRRESASTRPHRAECEPIQSGGRHHGFFFGRKVPRVGTVLKQDDPAKTLRAIAKDGPAPFYTGEIAEMLRALKEVSSLITAEDLRTYNTVWRKPVSGESGMGHTVYPCLQARVAST